MCGEMDDDGPSKLEDHLYSSFLTHTRAVLAAMAKIHHEEGSPSAYADKLFADALNRSVRDAEAREPSDRYPTLAFQALVFARLAGFLASHIALPEDPLRKVMDALMHGYGEVEHLEPYHGHDHDDDHDHDHDHGHAHHHGHDHGHHH